MFHNHRQPLGIGPALPQMCPSHWSPERSVNYIELQFNYLTVFFKIERYITRHKSGSSIIIKWNVATEYYVNCFSVVFCSPCF